MSANILSPVDAKEILREFFATTEGRDWSRVCHWESSSPLTDWEGLKLNDTGGLSKLSLVQNNISGETIRSDFFLAM